MMKKMKFGAWICRAVEATASGTGGQDYAADYGAAAFPVAEILQISLGCRKSSSYSGITLPRRLILMTADFWACKAAQAKLRWLRKEEVTDLGGPKRCYLFSPLVLFNDWLDPWRLHYGAGIHVLIFTLVVVLLSVEPVLTRCWSTQYYGAGRGRILWLLHVRWWAAIIGTVVGSGPGLPGCQIYWQQQREESWKFYCFWPWLCLWSWYGLTHICRLPGTCDNDLHPAMIVGVLPIAAHLFLFYFGIIPMLPACSHRLSCMPWRRQESHNVIQAKCGFAAFKLALSGFILPFMFCV